MRETAIAIFSFEDGKGPRFKKGGARKWETMRKCSGLQNFQKHGTSCQSCELPQADTLWLLMSRFVKPCWSYFSHQFELFSCNSSKKQIRGFAPSYQLASRSFMPQSHHESSTLVSRAISRVLYLRGEGSEKVYRGQKNQMGKYIYDICFYWVYLQLCDTQDNAPNTMMLYS